MYDHHMIAILPPTELLHNKYKIPQYFIKRRKIQLFSCGCHCSSPFIAHIIAQILHFDEKCAVEKLTEDNKELHLIVLRIEN